MSLFEAILLGIVQGLTEFLPVSSSGHLELAKALLGSELGGAESLHFTLALHGATALSTIVVFRKDIWEIIRSVLTFKKSPETHFVFCILISMIPVFIIGMAFKDQIESLFNGNLIVVGTCLLVTALLLFASSRIQTQAGEITFKRSFIIGIAQAIAILPGLSRSGATISTALISGVSREKAARFSFLMVLPVIIGAMILDLKDFSEESTASMVPTASLIAGFLAAFLAGIAACHWMIAIVKRSKLDYFAYYCALVGTIALVVALFFLE